MKNKIFTIILSVILLMPAAFVNAETIPAPEDNTIAEEEVTEINSEDLSSEEASMTEAFSENQDIPYKQPISKKKLVKKFLLAMLAVGASSLILYFGLSVYNRIREGLPVQIKTSKGDSTLSAPDDFSDAVKTFLEKTNWNK